MIVVGLVIGVIVGFGIGYMMYQPQISQLQSTLSDTQSDLSASQSEVQSLQGQLAEARTNITSLETQLSQSQAAVTSLENQLEAKETEYSALSTEYSALSTEYNKFKSDVNSLVNSFEKKMELESQIIMMWVHGSRGEGVESAEILLGLGTYVDAVGDSQLSTIWDELFTYLSAGQTSQVQSKLADLMERNSALIQTDLAELNTLLGG